MSRPSGVKMVTDKAASAEEGCRGIAVLKEHLDREIKDRGDCDCCEFQKS